MKIDEETKEQMEKVVDYARRSYYIDWDYMNYMIDKITELANDTTDHLHEVKLGFQIHSLIAHMNSCRENAREVVEIAEALNKKLSETD